jgi:hypothetical protein
MKTLIKIKATKQKPKPIIEAVSYLKIAPVREHNTEGKSQSTLELKYGKCYFQSTPLVYHGLLLDMIQCVPSIPHPCNPSLLKMFSF